jgi:chromosome segregation protein
MAKQQAQALAENNAESFERERAKLTDRQAEAEAERIELAEEKAELDREAADARARVDALANDSTHDRDALEHRQAELDDRTERHAEAQRALEADKQALFDVLTAINDARGEANALDASVQDLAQRIDRLRHAGRTAGDKSKQAIRDARGVETELVRSRQLRLDLESRQHEQEESLVQLRSELESAEVELAALKDEASDKRARLASLVEIQKNYEGCTEAVRALMKRQASGVPSVHGLVADVVSAEPRFEAAVEAVLGDRLQFVIVDSQQDGVESIQFLRDSGEGRSTFVPLDLREDHVSWAPRRRTSRPPLREAAATADLEAPSDPASPASLEAGAPERTFASDAGPAYPAPRESATEPGPDFHAPVESGVEGDPTASHLVPVDHGSGLPVPEAADSFFWVETEDQHWPDLEQPGVVGKMVDLIRAQPGYEHVARSLLGDVVVVEDLDRARDLWRENGHRKTLVTLQGEVLDPVGLLTGGGASDRSAGILAKKRRIKELTEETRALESKVALTQERHDRLRKRVADIDEALKDLAKKGHAGELSIVNQERDLARLRQDADREAEAEQRTHDEVSALEEDREARVRQASERRDRVDALTADKDAAEARVRAASERVAQLAREVQEAQQALADLRVEVAARREKRDGVAQTLDRTQRRIEEVAARELKIAQIIEDTTREATELQARVGEFLERGAQLKSELTDERVELDRIQEQLIEDETELRAESTATKEKRAEIDALKEEAGERTMKLREGELARQNLIEQIDERYRVDVAQILVDYHAEPRLSSAQVKSIKKLRRQIDQMGPINLTAIEECEEVRGAPRSPVGPRGRPRGGRGGPQERDPPDQQDEQGALRGGVPPREREVPARLPQALQRRPLRARHDRRERSARVRASRSWPSPPGKKLQNVSLLSGGEKALTAVSLIFAIFLIKPTPFCLLDEVDAPLDEANVGRYNDMLREMSAISQFILITHNKRTMELPDRLLRGDDGGSRASRSSCRSTSWKVDGLERLASLADSPRPEGRLGRPDAVRRSNFRL